MSDQSPAKPPVEPAAVAAYIADILLSLAAMAKRQRLDALVYLLEMALMEAQTLSGSAAKRRRSG